MRTLDLDSLEIFRTVIAEGGVIRAAAKLNRVQSNVTTRIRQLEERLGHQLFLRRGRNLELAPAGRRLLPLVTLLDLSMLFPDQAPSRLAVARAASRAGRPGAGSAERDAGACASRT